MANFAIGTKVRLYRKQQDPVGGDVAQIPPKESVGKVVAVEGKFVRVRFVLARNIERLWWVHESNLAKLTEEDYQERVARIRQEILPAAGAQAEPAEAHYVVAKKVEKLEAAPKDEWAAFVKTAYERNGLVAYEFNGTKKPADICFYAAMVVARFTSFHILTKHKFEKIANQDALKKYLTYLLNDSPCKDVYEVKDVGAYLKEVIKFNVKGQHKYRVLLAAFLLRHVWEYSKYLNIWNELVDSGVNPNMAVLVASMFRNGKYSEGDGHTAFYTMENPQAFIKGDFNKEANTLYKFSRSYNGGHCKLKSFLEGKEVFKKNKYGYNEALDWGQFNAVKLVKEFEEKYL